ncbi:dihydrolipoyl dehydrogenase family protein [Agromyces aureus]|uniref:Pyridine nucleotide-disulfide oxidoreductase n=1 Tax=Agromyces aureus TaxID=453304 RepID=A0A191WH64_9MICO|nr:NAD(P)/FAD-dependent oxidoreductase [Agromyces aureus]ANJ27601.1 pyridine nucleotide-disulfide oxidoreductase [Agromyces aureus]
MQREVDVVILGAGPVGENVADRVRAAGLEVVIVEHELVGGECSYWACVPSKVLLRSAAALRAAKRVPGAAEAVTGDLDVEAVLRRRDSWVSDWDDHGAVGWLDDAGIGLERGHGRLDGPKRVVVTRDGDDERDEAVTFVARHAVIVATGSDPVMPSIEGLAESSPWTSREATSVERPPARLAILGGGVVACEMATVFAGFGTEVVVLARSGLLGAMEPFVGDAVTAGLRGLGATVRTGVQATLVERTADGEVVLTLDDGSTVVADEVLVATGRKPRTDAIGLETVGLEPGDWLRVDEGMAVEGVPAEPSGENDSGSGTPWLYAAGDVNHRALLTHQGKYQGRAAGDLIAARAAGHPVDLAEWGVHAATADHVAVPQVVFAEPEAVAVGLTEAAATKAGRSVRTVEVSMTSASGAGILADGYEGRAKLVIDDELGTVIGATFTGQDVAELLHAATVAIVGEVPVERLWHAVPSFPTMSEIWLRLLEADGRPEARA